MKKPIRQAQGKRVFSGIRATGRLHLGNYLGAVKGMIALQKTHDCVFSVVDMHTITTPYTPATLQESIRNIVLDYLAAGLDPKKCKLEVQSKVPEHVELAYLLSTIYPVARLEDLPTYKEKKAQFPKYVNMGLLFYPMLMAADILLYKAELVPAGVDQEPHLEVTREIARKFNGIFGETFPQTQRFHTNGEHIPSLLGTGKMSKSIDGSYINLTDDLETIKKRLAAAPTDSGTVGGEVPKDPPATPDGRQGRAGGGVANLFKLLKLFESEDTYKKFEQDYRIGAIKYSEMKPIIAEAIYKELHPIQGKRKYFEENPAMVNQILKESNEKCSEIAKETIREVKEKMGLAGG